MLLVNKNPKSRPSAAELLNSSLLPTRIGLDRAYLKEVTDALLSNVNKDVNSEIISTLFKRRETLIDQDAPTGSFVKLHGLSAVQRVLVEQSFRFVAQLHGAVDFRGMLLNSPVDDASAVSLLEPSGKVVILPKDLITNFVAYAAKFGIVSSVRYNIDRIFETSGSTSNPIERTEAAFDILSSDLNSAPLLRAQALIFVNSFLLNLPNQGSLTYGIRLGDCRLATSILDLCGVTNHLHRDEIIRLMSPTKSRKEALTSLTLQNEVGTENSMFFSFDAASRKLFEACMTFLLL